MTSHRPGLLVLEDGWTADGLLFGADGVTAGEVCFNTSMSGYQEILTDPSYREQIVTMTAPQIGNYGVSDEDLQAPTPQAAGFVVRALSNASSCWRASGGLDDYLRAHGVVGIAEVDTRALTRRLRSAGAMRGAIGPASLGAEALAERARGIPSMAGRDLAGEAGGETIRVVGEDGDGADLAVLDFGCKAGILASLRRRDCRLTLYPPRTPADQILAGGHAGVLLSNGPGDPEVVTYGIETARALLGKTAVYGICLGHQILGLACGGQTFKLKFGHRGGNHPVRVEASGRVLITAQNHGFAVDPGSLPDAVRVTQISLNDGTCEGLEHVELPAWSVQYHPEASPGPNDADPLFDRMAGLV